MAADAALSVPGSWRVVDAGAEAGCPVFDAPALYLHAERADPGCPAPVAPDRRAVGVAVLDAASLAQPQGTEEAGDAIVLNGHDALRRRSPAGGGNIRYLVAGLGVALDVSPGGDPGIVDRVVATLRPATAADRENDAAERAAGPTSDCSGPTSPPDGRALPGWTPLPQPPFTRARASAVSTGDALFYFGGDTAYGSVHHDDAATFDLATRSWRCLPKAPVPGRSAAAAVWTGAEVLVWGGRPGGPGAAYHFGTGRWRLLPGAPIPPRAPAAAVWTGKLLLVWGDTERTGARVDGAPTIRVPTAGRACPTRPRR